MMRTVTLLVTVIAIHLAAAPPASAQDPSEVSGYIAFADPATGALWLPLSPDGTAVVGFPTEVAVVFRSRTGAGERRVRFTGTWCGTGYVGRPETGAMAVPYRIRLTQRADAPEPGAVGVCQAAYNPDQWQFDRVEMGPWSYSGRTIGGISIPALNVPLTRRASPFSELR